MSPGDGKSGRQGARHIAEAPTERGAVASRAVSQVAPARRRTRQQDLPQDANTTRRCVFEVSRPVGYHRSSSKTWRNHPRAATT